MPIPIRDPQNKNLAGAFQKASPPITPKRGQGTVSTESTNGPILEEVPPHTPRRGWDTRTQGTSGQAQAEMGRHLLST